MEPLYLGKPGDPGHSGKDNRQFENRGFGVGCCPLGLCSQRYGGGGVTMTEVMTATRDDRPKRHNGSARDVLFSGTALATHLGTTRQNVAKLTAGARDREARATVTIWMPAARATSRTFEITSPITARCG
jgi:hypothetical protein